MEEMLDETLEGLDEDSELEEEAEAEVDQVLFEITDGKLGVAGQGKALPVRDIILESFVFTDPFRSQTLNDQEEEINDKEMARMQEQLNALLSG
jgi:charged multivesicular body protein 3